MTYIIIAENLTKHFGHVHAVKDLSLNIKKGEIFGFLGLNGAGKTTTIRMLLGMIKPTSGVSFICSKKIHSGNIEIWGKIGYLVEVPYSYPELTVRENLEIIRRLRFINDRKAIDSIIDKFHLGEYANRKVKDLSQGNLQRLGLAKALIHNPEILLLDEPANGLDPAGIVEIRELLQDMAFNHGVTVFISSHILGEISKIATRIGIIHEGLLIQEIDTCQLDQLLQKKLILNTSDINTALKILSQSNYPANITDEGNIEISDQNAINHPEAIATLLVQHSTPPTLLKVEEEDLESYFLRKIGMKGKVL
jgi:ABC-2 type transport system ATP-binding protein